MIKNGVLLSCRHIAFRNVDGTWVTNDYSISCLSNHTLQSNII